MAPLDANAGDTAWLLTAAALVLLMTPGLALFYGGMVRAKSVLNMMMMSFAAMAVVPVLWVLYGYSLAFGNDVGGGLLGSPSEFLGLKGMMTDTGVGTPVLAFVGFQCVFAIITVALISGAIADRAKFSTWLVFVAVWVTVVYFPIAHWVFDFTTTDSTGAVTHVGGWLANRLHVIDFAGGTAVHIDAGAAGLALALVLGKRLGFRAESMRPHNLTLVMLGAGLLWFGWFGFNAGSAINAGNTAAVAWMNTLVATAAACLGWLFTERVRDGHFTSLGAASGVVAGLVAITPACSALSPVGSIALGLIAGFGCCLSVGLKYRFGFDDSLDVVGVHLVGGLIGTIGIGFLATAAAPAGVNGLVYGGGFGQLWRQSVGAVTVMVVSFGATYAIGQILHKTLGFRVADDHERAGIDEVVHAESGYDLGGGLRGVLAGGVSPPPHRSRHAIDAPLQDAATKEVGA